MAGTGTTSLRTALKKGCSNGGGTSAELIPREVQTGFGTPTHTAPPGTIYVKLDATMGTSSHFRMQDSSWKIMSDD